MIRILFFLVGFGFTIIGSIYLISYLNLLTIGYNFLDYVKFITRRLECYYFIIGMVIILISINKGEKNEIYIWYNFKF